MSLRLRPAACVATQGVMRGKPSSLSSRQVTVDGNRLILLTDGPDRLKAILDLIGSARTSLRLLYYIFAGDGSGKKVRDALVEARKRGVAVTVVIDDFGSSNKIGRAHV